MFPDMRSLSPCLASNVRYIYMFVKALDIIQSDIRYTIGKGLKCDFLSGR